MISNKDVISAIVSAFAITAGIGVVGILFALFVTTYF